MTEPTAAPQPDMAKWTLAAKVGVAASVTASLIEAWRADHSMRSLFTWSTLLGALLYWASCTLTFGLLSVWDPFKRRRPTT